MKNFFVVKRLRQEYVNLLQRGFLFVIESLKIEHNWLIELSDLIKC